MARPVADLLDYLKVMKCIRMMMLYMLLCYFCYYDLTLHSSVEMEGNKKNAIEQEIINNVGSRGKVLMSEHLMERLKIYGASFGAAHETCGGKVSSEK